MHNCFYVSMTRRPDDKKTVWLKKVRKTLAQSERVEILSCSKQGLSRSSWHDGSNARCLSDKGGDAICSK
jgi:hypothetical protein